MSYDFPVLDCSTKRWGFFAFISEWIPRLCRVAVYIAAGFDCLLVTRRRDCEYLAPEIGLGCPTRRYGAGKHPSRLHRLRRRSTYRDEVSNVTGPRVSW